MLAPARIRPVAAAALIALTLCGPALAATATLTYVFTVDGQPLADPEHARFYVYEPEERESYVGWGHGAKAARFPGGTYDVVIRYHDGAVSREIVREKVELSGNVIEELDLDLQIARLTVQVQAGGRPIAPYTGRVSVHPAGRRGKPLAAVRPGVPIALRPGVYDVEVAVRDLRGLRATWLEGLSLFEDRVETVDLGTPPARLTVFLEQDGVALPPDRTRWGIYVPGTRSEPLAQRRSGESADVPTGNYDLGLSYRTGRDTVERWIENVPLAGIEERRFELSATPTQLRVDVQVRDDLAGDVWCGVYRPGERGAAIAALEPGREISLDPDRYDVGCFFRREGLRAESWLPGVRVAGATRLDAALDPRPASLRVVPPRRGDRGERPARSNLLLLVDSSVTMGEGVELVQAVLPDVLRDARGDGLRVGLRAFGITPAVRNDCRDSSLLVPLAPVDTGRIERTLDLLRPAGLAPLAHSLQLAGRDLPENEINTLVLITGSVEQCSGDVCGEASRLLRRGAADRGWVLGVGLGRRAQPALECIGRYEPVDTRRQLRVALQRILRDVADEREGTVSLFLPDWSAWVATGRLGERLEVSAGDYGVLVRYGGRTFVWEELRIRGDRRYTAGPRP